MNIRELQNNIRVKIGPEGDALGAEILLAFVLGKDRAYLFSHDDDPVLPAILQTFVELLERMLAGEPVAYLLGHKEFFGMDFFVDKRVLIPRPETEHLVEWILDYCGCKVLGKSLRLDKPTGPLRVLDVGTGSGCIAITLAKNFPFEQVTGVDISKDALDVAFMNVEHHQQKQAKSISFFQSDLLESVDDPFDIVVANLPYIGEKRFSFVSKAALDYEPHVALFGGQDGLGLYRKFFQQLAQKQWRPKVLLGEFGFLQRDELEVLFKEIFPEQKICFEQDYANIDRMFVVRFS